MRIKTLSYKDSATGWELQPISFDQITLLVGASGVGKTRVLKSILDIKRIAEGSSLNGVEWNVEFLTVSGTSYIWKGRFEEKGFSIETMSGIFSVDSNEKDKSKIESEFVYRNESLVVERNGESILFNGERTVKLSRNESVIFLLREEEQIQEAYREFDKIIFDDRLTSNIRSYFDFDEEFEEKITRYNSIEEIRDSSESVRSKLYITYKNQKESFDIIVKSFIDVFSYVEEVKFEPIAHNGKKIPLFFREMPIIQIKERGVGSWIPENRISSGMIRTLMHIAELYLCADSSLILIDEFENSLGVNCIDELANSIVTAERSLQFIITSHHPYIINSIHPASWKIITRKAGSVISHDGRELNFDKSKHKAFTQLINLDLYSEGVES